MEMSDANYAALSPKDLRNFGNPLRLPGEGGLMGELDASDAPVRAVARAEAVEILPGRRTELWVYGVEAGGRSYTNPTYRVRRGSRFSAELFNGLDAETTIHWHGLGVPAEMDGHPPGPLLTLSARVRGLVLGLSYLATAKRPQEYAVWMMRSNEFCVYRSNW